MFGLLHLAALSAAAVCASALPQQQTTPGVDSDFVCPAADMQQTHCMGPKDCLYPMPGNCANYIQCQPTDGTYETEVVRLAGKRDLRLVAVITRHVFLLLIRGLLFNQSALPAPATASLPDLRTQQELDMIVTGNYAPC
ncbi:hypothetical protein CERZMDRAFT_99298 [Cercospora zeae-maydis SCOH1-5]|uniref:Uncharacterized protein n=1 Tax=Cercospora zeae-maydis SCOH1-5 TaxID=717836 RepID=A0A6A6FBJ8_9PEZI|nr:hypothetical protein CERZMDRAFT_99298 [Cercospora zeae-maydis SCOH1-5]